VRISPRAWPLLRRLKRVGVADFDGRISARLFLAQLPPASRSNKIKIERALVMNSRAEPRNSPESSAPSSTSATASKCRSSAGRSRQRNSSAPVGRGLRSVPGLIIGKPLRIGQYGRSGSAAAHSADGVHAQDWVDCNDFVSHQ